MSMVGTHPHPAVPYGPRAFRSRIRRLGPFVALLPACILGIGALLLLHNNATTLRGVAGFAAAVLAAPGLLMAGIPLTTQSGRMLLGILGSVLLWMAVGLLASRRATRSPVASWRDYWREFAWLACGIWIGVVVGLAVVELVVGRALL